LLFDRLPFILDAAAALEASPLGAAMRGSLYAPANVAHLLGLVMLVGAIGVVDLRIIGLGRRIHLASLSRMLTPIAIAGLVLALATGFLMFSADATPMLGSWVFQLKVVLIVIGIANALLFRQLFGDLDRGEPPMAARVQSLASLGLWLTVGALGRLIAYN
jgi:hypothetical protein